MCAVFMLLCVLWQFKRHVYRKSLWLGWQAGTFYRYYDQQWHAVEPINVLVLPWLIRFSLANEFEAGDPRKDATIYNAEVKLDDYNRAFMNTGYFNKK